MKDFYELQLQLEVKAEFAEVYKKAITTEQDRYLTEHQVIKPDGEIVFDRIKSVWSGNHVVVEILPQEKSGKATLMITAVSHTLENLKQWCEWYQRTGDARIVYKNY